MKSAILLSLLFFSFSAIAQNDTIYRNRDGLSITKPTYKNNLMLPNTTSGTIRDSAAVTFRLFDRTGIYQIKSKEMESVMDEIERLSGKKIPRDQIVVIEHVTSYQGCYHKRSPQLENMVKANIRKYFKKMSKLKNVAPLFITADDDRNYIPDGIPVYTDKNNYFKDRFFPADFSCNSVLIIHPIGAYYCQYGEHRTEDVLKIIKLMEKTAAEGFTID